MSSFSHTLISYLDLNSLCENVKDQENQSSACSVYALYIGKCRQYYTNNWQVSVNARWVGDFWGSRPHYEYRPGPGVANTGYDKNITEPYDGMFACPVAISQGAPFRCIWQFADLDPLSPVFNPIAFPEAINMYGPGGIVNQCGSDEGVLYLLGRSWDRAKGFGGVPNFRADTWPRKSGAPKGSRWAPLPYPRIASHYTSAEPIGDIAIAPNTSMSSEFRNVIGLYAYNNWWDTGPTCLLFYLLYTEEIYNEDGELIEIIEHYDTNDIPQSPEALPGVPGCIGIIKYNIDKDGALYNDTFYPVKKEGYLTNYLANANAAAMGLDEYNFWTEAHIRVSHNPLPDWINPKNYSW